MFNIGLTGGIGSGKSTVSRWLREQGFPVLDADQIVHELLSEDQETIDQVVVVFGREILRPEGGVDRKKLGAHVFSDTLARKGLEEIIHPRVGQRMDVLKADLQRKAEAICFWDIPLLFESGFDKFVSEVWVVWVPLEIQIERVMKRDGLSRNDVLLRIQAQMPLQEKALKADFTLDNSGTWNQTKVQLEKQLSRINDRVREYVRMTEFSQ